jgi:hypothetical protein
LDLFQPCPPELKLLILTFGEVLGQEAETTGENQREQTNECRRLEPMLPLRRMPKLDDFLEYSLVRQQLPTGLFAGQ